jgi:hypothetical protein
MRNGRPANNVAYAHALNTLAEQLRTTDGTAASIVPVLPVTDDGKQRRRARLEQKQQHKPERFRAIDADRK